MIIRRSPPAQAIGFNGPRTEISADVVGGSPDIRSPWQVVSKLWRTV